MVIILKVEKKINISLKKCFRVKSWRISLTENCNYACFFCHEEGLDMTKARSNPKTLKEIYSLSKIWYK